MPWACPMEIHVTLLDLSSSLHSWLSFFPDSFSVNLHGAGPWHPGNFAVSFLAAIVNLHGASPWHPGNFAVSFLAAIVTLHGASPWHRSVFLSALSRDT